MISSILVVTVVTALIAAINPCTMGVFTHSIASLLGKGKHPRHAAAHSMLFTLGIGISYAAIGSALMVLVSTLPFALIGNLATVVGIVLVFMGCLEIKDYYWYGKGPSFKIGKRAEKAIHGWTKRHHSIWRGFLLGVFTAGAQIHYMLGLLLGYVLIITLSGISSVYLPWLWALLYITPLLSLSQLVLYGVSTFSIAAWKENTKESMRLWVGLLFVVIGWVLILMASGGMSLV